MSSFRVTARDGAARTGVLVTRRGAVRTPAFMPVGTNATVKACHPDEVRGTGADILLCNAYHLLLRPGLELVKRAGGLHDFMGWDGPILTDSGGYQLWSLSALAGVDDDGADFFSPHDGSRHRVTPEGIVALQAGLDADVLMVLDQPAGYGATPGAIADATERTHRWAERSRAVHPGDGRLLFGIVQGGADATLRRDSARVVAGLGFDGVAIGGLSLGEPATVLEAMAAAALEELPEKLPRYLMGLGSDAELLAMVALGVDMFDCVLPTRLARSGTALTPEGRLVLRRARHREELGPLEEGCPCPACQRFSRAYLRHLVLADELLAHRLLSLHNLTHLGRLMAAARGAIAAGRLDELRRERLRRLAAGPAPVTSAAGPAPAPR